MLTFQLYIVPVKSERSILMLASAWVGAAAGQMAAVLAVVAWAWVTDAGSEEA